jgi:hypothetical protein
MDLSRGGNGFSGLVRPELKKKKCNCEEQDKGLEIFCEPKESQHNKFNYNIC